MAKKLAVPLEAVMQQLSQTSRSVQEGKITLATAKDEPKKARREMLEERLLSLAFQSDPAYLKKRRVVSLFQTPLAKRILEEYISFSGKKKVFSPSKFSQNLPKELFDGYAAMVLSHQDEHSPDDLKREISAVEKEIMILDVRARLEEWEKKIRGYEESSQKDKLVAAQRTFDKLARKLSLIKQSEIGSVIFQEK